MATNLKNLSDFSHMDVGSASDLEIAIVVAQWNAQVTSPLLEGAYNRLLKEGAVESKIHVLQVPGSYELSSGADIILRKKQIDAVICIGCVIQGDTPHFTFICDAVANGITNVSLKYNKPVIFGVLTTNTLEQALDRAGGKHGNKGEEAAVTAIQMANLSKSISA
ncbi:6,7-dimethyl-8-ribityllumazine synthase [Olivibacter sp. XZL3]|uniref:6,7-dimethyl-8-ribityllumazine synthase n=1 Tax=Olivibacter sp. XZL3 TaxID=1735116 RepID=UPI001065219F|nr:6,7-dimethyl-8-ribityllumazine synthase [Olivibacter sp. XZL3]